jgi:hypothetical protein
VTGLSLSLPGWFSVWQQDERDDLTATWLDLVVAGAGSALADAIARIPELTPQVGVWLVWGDLEGKGWDATHCSKSWDELGLTG